MADAESSEPQSPRETVEDEARARVEQAGREAAARADEQRKVLVREMSGVADALRMTADQLDEQEQSTIASFTRRASEMVRNASSSLERKGMDELVNDVRRMARERPALLGGASALVGFLGAQLMSHSGSASSGSEERMEGPASGTVPKPPAPEGAWSEGSPGEGERGV
ncbi:MAG: hypothetical protein ACOC97_02620 [Myxococcota bacterium]